jgi:hypothetical protein
MLAEIVPQLLNHEGGPAEARASHRCEARVRLACCACHREFVFCSASESDMALSLERRWRCDDCGVLPWLP